LGAIANLNWRDPWDWNAFGKGTILMDQLFTMGTTSTDNFPPIVHRFRFRVGRKVNWSGDGTAHNDGFLYIFAVSDSSAVTHPNIEVGLNLSFLDI